MTSVADKAMRKALAANGYPTTDGSIATSGLAAITRLSWSEEGFGEHDPSGWERVTDLAVLANAHALRELDFGGNNVTSLEPLRGHAALEQLWVHDNDLRDASALGTMPNLRVANLSTNPRLTTLGDLRGATALTRLNVSYTGVRDFESLLDLPSLRELSICGIAIEPHEPAFEVLVRLGGRVVIAADPPLLDLIKAEAGRRSIADNSDEVVAKLAEAGLDALAAQWSQGANALDDRGATVLHLLAEHRHLDDATRATLTRRVVAAGAALDAVQRNFPNIAPLGAAVAARCSPEYAQLLIDLGADPSYPPSHPPLSHLRDDGNGVLRVLVDAGADLTQPRALLALVAIGDAELLARASATANLDVEVEMQSPLIAAVAAQRDDLVQVLLDAGADPNFAVGGQPLHRVRALSTYELLIKAGANPRATTSLGTVLHSYARLPDRALGNAEALMRRAVADGVDPRATDMRQSTALHTLAESRAYGDAMKQVIALVAVLLELGVDPRALNRDGKTARDIASADLKKALGAAKVPTSAAVLKDLNKALATPGAAAWDAATRLAHVNYGEALAPYREPLAAALANLDGELAGFAAFKPTSRIAAFLLADGATAITPSGESTLHLALEARAAEVEGGEQHVAAMVRALIAAGANPHAIAGDGASALALYTNKGGPWDINLIQQLLSRETVNAPVVHSPLANIARQTALLDGDARDAGNAIVDLLVEAGANLTVPDTLAALCALGRVELVKLARERGANLFADIQGKSLLYAATDRDSVAMMKYLLEVGVSANSGNPGGRAIHRVRSVAAFDLLHDAGADLADPDSYGGVTALHSLAKNFQVPAAIVNDLVQRFEANGVLRTTANKHGETPQEILARRPDF